MPNIIQLLQHHISSKAITLEQLINLLHVSEATMRRKLHGDSAFTIDEVFVLQQKFGFSIDALSPNAPASLKVFSTKEFALLPTPVQTVGNYVQQLLNDFMQLNTLGAPHIYYAAKDLPLFCFFSSPLLTSFKLYFWYISLFDTQQKNITYSSSWLPEDVLQNAAQLYAVYNHVPSTEIWNQETINSTLHQIAYCKDAGNITSDQAKSLCQALLLFIDNLEHNAANNEKAKGVSLTMYLNEILLLDNTVLFTIGAHKVFYLPYQTLNFLSTSDAQFTENTFNWFAKQINKSTLISGEAQKTRKHIINIYKQEIEKILYMMQ
jgi:hypothetical protein